MKNTDAPILPSLTDYLSPEPHAEPQAAGFSSGLSPEPHAEPQAAGLSFEPHAAGLSPEPQAVPVCALTSSFHPAMLFNAIIVFLLHIMDKPT
jgi:hypothetical protein